MDLGGIDGLLHITDMSWGRVNNPHEVVHIDQELEVYILKVDKEKEKIALGLKQKTPSPWANVADKYPVGSRHTGEVVNVMSYGAFVKLEPGIEGLVHISEMSWTKRINHPSELVSIGDQIEVQVLNINKEKQEISLGMKQVQPNPWDKVAETLSAGHGHHRRGPQPDQLRRLHRDRGRHRRPAARQRHELGAQGRPPQRGGAARATRSPAWCSTWIRSASGSRWASSRWPTTRGKATSPAATSPARSRRARSPSSPTSASSSSWSRAWKGLLHISELADHKVESPEDVVKVGDEIEVKVLRVDAGRPQDRPEPQAPRLDRRGRGRPRRPREAGGDGRPSRSASCAAAPGRAAASCSACRSRRAEKRSRRPSARRRRSQRSRTSRRAGEVARVLAGASLLAG